MAWNYFPRRQFLLCAKIFSEVTKATRFWTPQFLVLLAFIFKHKWNPVSENHNSNFTCTDFSLSVIEEPVIRSIWCLASFDSQLHNHFTRWRRYNYGICPSLTSLLLLGGDIELNPGPAHKLKVAYFNARSLVNKSASLEVDVYSKIFDIVAITETHLDQSVNSAELFPSNYRVYRRDRNRRGGGVLVAVSDKIICKKRDVLEESDIELLMLDIHYSKNKSFVFGVFYRPPASDTRCLEILQRNLEHQAPQAEIILVGDFNLKDVDWNSRLMLNNSVDYRLFSDILSDNFLTQMVLQPTRGNNILDLVLTNNSDVICDAEVGEPISDHNIITFNVNVHPYHRKSSERKFYDYNKADWSRLNELFEHIPCHCAFLSNDVIEVPIYFLPPLTSAFQKRKRRKIDGPLGYQLR